MRVGHSENIDSDSNRFASVSVAAVTVLPPVLLVHRAHSASEHNWFDPFAAAFFASEIQTERSSKALSDWFAKLISIF